MKRILLLLLLAQPFFSCTTLQQAANSFPSTTTGNSVQQSQIVEGLKQALTIGTQNSTNRLSAVDGFFADAAIKILMQRWLKMLCMVQLKIIWALINS